MTAQQTHLAIEYRGSSTAVLTERPSPTEPLGAGELAGTTLVTLVSPGTELALFPRERERPWVPGYAAVFRVEEVGADVTGWRPGDLAFAQGPHAAIQRVAAAEARPVPIGLAPEVAVFARLLGVGWATLATTAARPADRVLVIGLGVVGHLAAAAFHAGGYRVTAVDPLEGRRRLAERAGIPEVLAAIPAGDDGPDGFALVVDCSGHEGAILAGVRAARWGGEVVLVGAPWAQRTDDTAHAVMDAVFHRYVRLRSGWEWQLPMLPSPFGGGSTMESFESAMHWLAEGRIDVAPLASVESPADAERVLVELGARGTEHLTAVFDWRVLAAQRTR